MHTSEPPSFSYKAFISYSHAADGMLARKLQSGLHQFAKPWYRFRAIRVFRDDTSLSNAPELWPSIEAALSKSEYFLLLASPEATNSPWVKKEIEYWVNNRSKDKLLIILTGGDLKWDNEAKGFDWTATTALPEDVTYPFEDEPRYTDFREVKSAEHLSVRNPTFRAVVADVSSTLLGRSKDELIGEDVRRHRQTKQIAWSAAIALLVLTVVSIVAAYVAVQKQQEADRRMRLAESRQLGAQALLASQRSDKFYGYFDRALLLGLEAIRTVDSPENRGNLLRVLQQVPPQFDGYLHGNTNGVRSVAFSPDGSILASGGSDGTVRLWQLPERQLLRVLRVGGQKEGELNEIWSVTFSPDGELLAAGDSEGSVHLWFVRGWKPWGKPLIHPRRDQYNIVSEVAFHPSGNILACGMTDGIVQLWNVADRLETAKPSLLGEPLRVYRYEDDDGYWRNMNLAFRPDGKVLATAIKKTLRVWDVEKREALGTAQVWEGGDIDWYGGIAFHPGGVTLATTSSYGRAITLWDLQDLRKPTATGVGVSTLEHSVSVAFSPGGKTFSLGNSNSLAMWRWDDDPLIVPDPHRIHHDTIWSMALSPDGRFLVTGGRDNNVAMWDVTRDIRIGEMLRGSERRDLGEVWRKLAFSRNGEILASLRDTPNVKRVEVWSVQNRKKIGEILPKVRSLSGLALSPEGQVLAVGSDNGDILLWDLTRFSARGEPLVDPTKKLVGHSKKVIHLEFGSRGEFLASAGVGEIKLWNVSHESPKSVTLPHESGADVVFSPNGRTLASYGVDIKLWDVDQGVQIAHFGKPTDKRNYNRIASLVFGADGSTVVIAREDRTVETWNVAESKLVHSSSLQQQGGERFNFGAKESGLSPTGQILALSEDSESVQLWDAKRFIPLGEPLSLVGVSSGMDKVIFSGGITFSPDGQIVATVHSDGSIVLWDLNVVARACRLVGRNASQREWERYKGNLPYRKTCDRYLPGD